MTLQPFSYLNFSTVVSLVLIYLISEDDCVGLARAHTPLTFDTYHNYDEMTEFLKRFTEENAQFTELYSIGRSVQKRELWVVQVHNKRQHNSARIGVPQVKVIGNMHGNEPVGRELILHMTQYLVNRFKDGDQYIQWLVNNTRIHLMPSLNPDGFEVAREGVCGPSRGRDNYKGYDLNRNFPDFFRRNMKPIQPETVAVTKWLQNNSFVLSASLHGGSLVASYPFENTPEDIWAPLYKVLNDANTSEQVITLWKKLPNGGLPFIASPTPDDDVFHYLATLYARLHPTMHLGKPCRGTSQSFKDGAVNGALWYPFIGGMQDFNYAKHGCMEITFEITCCRYPYARELEQIWEDNRQALVTFMSQAHRGMHGVVRNKEGQPIRNAVLQILGRNMTFNTSRNGEFWRILLPGNYLLQVEADGFVTKLTPFTVPKVEEESTPVHLWLELEMESVSTSHNSSGSKTVCCDGNCNSSASATDCQWSTTQSPLSSSNSISWEQSDLVMGNASFLQSPSSTESVYQLHLVVVNEVVSATATSRNNNSFICMLIPLLIVSWLYSTFSLVAR